MKVIDNIVDPIWANAVYLWLQGQPLLFGWSARKDAQGKFWHRNFVLPGTYANHYDSPAIKEELTYERFILENNPLSHVAKQVCEKFFNGTPLTRIWVNVQSFGDESAIHRDFPIQFKGSAQTVVWYPVPEWGDDWGGDVLTLTDDYEIDKAARIRPNRMVAFDGTALHTARPMSRYCPAIRIAVAFGCEVVK